MAKKRGASKTSRSKSQRRVLDAFQLAEKAESRNGKNEESDEGSDDGFETQHGVLNARKLLGRNEDRAGSDAESEFEDEELDSDEALGSDDELDVLNSKFSQTLRDRAKAKKRGEIGIDDDDEGGYTSIDEDELMPLSAVWDLDDQETKRGTAGGHKADSDDIVLQDIDESESEEESASSSDDEAEASTDEEEVFGGFSDDDEEVDLSFVKKSLTEHEVLKRQKKKLDNLRLDENEYNLPTNGQKLSLADMMSGMDASATKEAVLIDADDAASSNRALAVPLPKRIQERHERRAAYEVQIDEVNKWEDTVKENRRAEVLQFPLNSTKESSGQVTSFDPSIKPMNALESKVNDMLEASALLDTKKESQFEDLAVAKMSKEEMQKRQNELRLMRELMFREEKKARRIKKIKSKTYHKIKKKELRRNAELVEGDESDEEDHDVKRAKERMTLKHKNNSDWAKSMIKSGMSKDAENRAEMEEMLRQGDKLKSRIMGYDGQDGSDSDNQAVSDLERDDEMSDEDGVRNSLGKGVMAMDFMKNAEKRARLENSKSLEQLRAFENGEDRLDGFDEKQTSVNVEKNEGRRVYVPSANRQKQEMDALNKQTLDELDVDESRSLAKRLAKTSKSGAKKPAEKADGHGEVPQGAQQDEEAANPWLAVANSKSKRSGKVSGVVDQNSSRAEKAQHQMQKKKNKRSAAEAAAEDAVIDMDSTFQVVDPYGGSEDEREPQDAEIHMFRQKDLIKEAFAGDDVVAEFEKEKKQVAREEGDKEIDVTLPGWGDWAGGNQKNKRKKVVRKVGGVVQSDKRKDRTLKGVIINEKVNKKNAKYQSNGVPYPFETMEQYERSLRMPIGQEWTSRETHQRLTMPRVISKHGTVIDPLSAPFK